MFISNILNNYVNKDSKSYRKVKKWTKVGGLMTGGSGVVLMAFPIILNTIFGSLLYFEEDNMFINIWKDIPVLLTTKLYIFNLENPEEFANGAKPILKEKGPYVYNAKYRHEVISWGLNGETLKFYLSLTWAFDPDKTVSDINEKLTLLNVPAYAGAGLASNILGKIPFSFALAPIVYGFMNVYFMAHGEGLIKEITPKDLIEGKSLGMIETVDSLVIKPLKWLGLNLPEFELLDKHMAQNKFGLLHIANGTNIGPYEVWTGKSDYSKFDKFVSFMGNPSLDFFDEQRCNLINGTEGLSYGTYLSKDDVIYLFFACRSFAFSYSGISFVKGTPQWKYTMGQSYFAGPKKNPSNKCYCNNPDVEMCDGVFDVSPCAFLAPAALSLPHFLYAGKKVKSLVEGMRPDPNKHECYINMNPTLGVPVDPKLRVQVNFFVKSHPLLYGFGSLPEAVFPFIWAEVGIEPDTLLNIIMIVGLNSWLLIDWGPSVLFCAGLGMLGYSSFIAVNNRKTLFKNKSQSIDRLDPIDKQMETKARSIYPNLFTVSEGTGDRPNHPPVYYDSQQQYNKGVQTSHRQTSPKSGPDFNRNQQQRVSSPPGAIE